MDVWKDVRDIEIANSIQGIVLQNDINVTSEDLPDYLKWSSEEVDAKLKGIMKNIHDSAYAAAEKFGMKGNYVAGANIAGFLKVANAMIAQGLV